jgi:hypothetical protein
MANSQAISAKVSGDYREYSRFRETRAGDPVRSQLRTDHGTLFRPNLRVSTARNRESFAGTAARLWQAYLNVSEVEMLRRYIGGSRKNRHLSR